MASKLGPTYGERAVKGATQGASPPATPRREPAEQRPAAAGPRKPSEILPPVPSTRPSAGSGPSSSREALVATAAYYRAEKRGFRPGHETEDWLAAERELDGTGTAPKF